MDTEPSKKFRCEFCGISLVSEKSLKTHQERSTTCLRIQHKAFPALTCPHCNDTFKSKYILTAHTPTCLKNQLQLLTEKINSKDAIIAEKDRELIEKNNEIIELKARLRRKSP